MAKVHIYFGILIVWILLFNFSGLIEDGGVSYILNNLGVLNPEGFSSTTFYSLLIGLSALSIVGISIGLYTGKSSDIILLATTLSFAAIMILILWDFVALFNILKQTNVYLATILISPMLVVFGLTIYEWVRGMST